MDKKLLLHNQILSIKMNLKKLYCCFLFLGMMTCAWSQSIEDYPWLNDILDTDNCCDNATVTAFNLGSFSYVYVMVEETCSFTNNKLYFEDGTCWCTDGNSLDCLSAYDLDISTGTTIFNCGENGQEGEGIIEIDLAIFEEFPWLSNIINPDLQQVQVINTGSFRFIYISDCASTMGQLYFETGEFYCMDAPNFDCLSLYGFTDLDKITALSCEGEEEGEGNGEGEETLVIRSSFFNSSSLTDFSIVNCTLENGSSTQCYQLTFRSNPVENGPYCPATIDDIGGVGIYDGATNPGFQVLKRSLWEAMEADGYDIVDEDGNINIVDPGAGMSGGGPGGPPPGGGGPPTGGGAGGGNSMAACLEAAPDDDLQLTFLIPVTPEMLSSVDELQRVENLGVSLDGIPLTGDPPSATMSAGNMPGGGGAIPSIDPCGGHMDPSGYYHLHFVAEEMNNVLDAHGITEVSCTNFAQSETALIGFAKDGFPIYASKDPDGTLPTDLDACHGHIGPTSEFPNGTYHYHASSSLAPNIPPCLVGASVSNSFSFQ